MKIEVELTWEAIQRFLLENAPFLLLAVALLNVVSLAWLDGPHSAFVAWNAIVAVVCVLASCWWLPKDA